MFNELRGAALLSGHRGAKPINMPPIVDVLCRLAALVDDLSDELDAIDLNPVLAFPEGRVPVVVDALIELVPR